MKHEVDYDIYDSEFCTPAQAAEIRRMKAELPLWQEMSQPHVVQGAIEPETTIDASQVQTDVELPANVSSAYNPDYGKWADAVAQHRAINDTTGMESEE